MFLKSQVSVEYIMIIGFVLVTIVPMVLIYYNYSNETRESVATSQALNIARKIADSAESVYYLGRPSQITLRMNFPENIVSTNLSNREVLFKISTSNGVTDVVETSSVDMNGTLPVKSGIYTLTIRAEEGFVQIISN